MQFGRKLLASRHPPWAAYYLDYARLQQMLEDTTLSPADYDSLTTNFVARLNEQVETIVLFLLHQQGEISHQLEDLWQKQRMTIDEHPQELSKQLLEIATQLLLLVQYVDLNVTGLRKILKKHDKITKHRISASYLAATDKATYYLLPVLLSDDGISALAVSLENLWQEQMMRKLPRPSKDGDRQGEQTGTPPAQHHHSSMLRHNNLSNVSLADMADMEDDEADPVAVVLLKIAAARRGLQQSSRLAKFLAAPMMADTTTSSNDDTTTRTDELELLPEPSALSDLLNLLSTFLYMTNYYIVAPTSAHYAQQLGSHASASALIIGMTPFAAIVSTVLYSWWTSHSYKSALLFASTCSLIGNVLYALGLPCDSLTLVLVGRLLNGFGSARSINRRYIADGFNKQDRTAASAAFVTAGALGMAAGPAIASLLHLTVLTDTNVYWQVENSPGWFMAGAWGMYLIVLLRFFENPLKRHHHEHDDEPSANSSAPSRRPLDADLEASLGMANEESPLLGNGHPPQGGQVQDKSGGFDLYGSGHDNSGLSRSERTDPLRNTGQARSTPATATKPPVATSPSLGWRNISVLTTFVIYFVLKMVLESSLSSAPSLTYFYFEWHSSVIGVFMAALGLLMLPANMLVASLSKTYEDRELILGLQVSMLAGCLLILKYGTVYTELQYIAGSIVLFVSASALEGPNMSLLSKVIPKSWRRGIFNVGLLATEAGTVGRVVADAFLTVCGSDGLENLLNYTFGGLSLCSAFTILITCCFFQRLEPIDSD